MSCLQILQSTATWISFYVIDNDVTADPRTGILYTEIDVSYKKYGDTSFTNKVLTGVADFREIGVGVYEVSFSAAELDTLGSFVFIINGNGTLAAPPVRQVLGQAVVVAAAAYTPGTITLSTNVLTGNIVDLQGTPVANVGVNAIVLSLPTVMGVTPNTGGITNSLVSAVTDASGFFALEVLQGAVIDISISKVNYRRTLTVPANSTDILFELA